MYTTSIFLISILMRKNKIFKRICQDNFRNDRLYNCHYGYGLFDCMLKGIDVVNIGNGLYVLVLVFDSGKVVNSVFNSKLELNETVLEELIYHLRKYLLETKASELVEKT